MSGLDFKGRRPLHRHQVTGARRLGSCTLPMAARQADRSHVADVGFFRYFVLANRQRSCNHWTLACVTPVSGEVQILFSHQGSLKRYSYEEDAKVAKFMCLLTIALVCVISRPAHRCP